MPLNRNLQAALDAVRLAVGKQGAVLASEPKDSLLGRLFQAFTSYDATLQAYTRQQRAKGLLNKVQKSSAGQTQPASAPLLHPNQAICRIIRESEAVLREELIAKLQAAEKSGQPESAELWQSLLILLAMLAPLQDSVATEWGSIEDDREVFEEEAKQNKGDNGGQETETGEPTIEEEDWGDGTPEEVVEQEDQEAKAEAPEALYISAGYVFPQGYARNKFDQFCQQNQVWLSQQDKSKADELLGKTQIKDPPHEKRYVHYLAFEKIGFVFGSPEVWKLWNEYEREIGNGSIDVAGWELYKKRYALIPARVEQLIEPGLQWVVEEGIGFIHEQEAALAAFQAEKTAGAKKSLGQRLGGLLSANSRPSNLKSDRPPHHDSFGTGLGSDPELEEALRISTVSAQEAEEKRQIELATQQSIQESLEQKQVGAALSQAVTPLALEASAKVLKQTVTSSQELSPAASPVANPPPSYSKPASEHWTFWRWLRLLLASVAAAACSGALACGAIALVTQAAFWFIPLNLALPITVVSAILFLLFVGGIIACAWPSKKLDPLGIPLQPGGSKSSITSCPEFADHVPLERIDPHSVVEPNPRLPTASSTKQGASK